MESMHIKTEESIRSLPFGDGHNVEMTNTPINSHGGGPLGGMPGQGPVYNGVGVAGAGVPVESNGGREVGGVIPHMARYQIGNGGGMADPALQECLSPFFQPFGVDVSHFPLTNPPIFQSSLTNFSDHPRRRRISISNGQISQLGDATHSFDDLYYTQPPPMPARNDRGDVGGENRPKVANVGPIPPAMPPQQQQQQHYVPPQTQHPVGVPPAHPLQHSPHGPVDINQAPPTAREEMYAKDGSLTSSFNNSADASLLGSEAVDSGAHGLNKDYSMARNVQMRAKAFQEDGPGTVEWKRARLLERNRIAASRCRQRKKIAHQQLQKDVTQLARDNRYMRKKLDYFEKLVTKFKKFTELHMASCGGSEQLSVIEDLLKIDHDLTEKDYESTPGYDTEFSQ